MDSGHTSCAASPLPEVQQVVERKLQEGEEDCQKQDPVEWRAVDIQCEPLCSFRVCRAQCRDDPHVTEEMYENMKTGFLNGFLGQTRGENNVLKLQ